MTRRHNFQTVSWFYDLSKRNLLDLNPPYQRRSVWNQEFKNYFVDTVLLNYPAPAIFLYEDIAADGRSVYHVVDGKQRLMTLLEFVRGDFPVSDSSPLNKLAGVYFTAFDDATKKLFWSYQFLVEYIPTDDERVINGIFDRINRNVAKLTPQELRHARLSGEFIRASEDLSEFMFETMPVGVPRFANQSKKQMKDVEFVALLLLLLEEGAKGYSQDALDEAFTVRDESWDRKSVIVDRFRDTIKFLSIIFTSLTESKELVSSRLRNQADFYSLFGAIAELTDEGKMIDANKAGARLLNFVTSVEDEATRSASVELASYFDAARSASNDKGPRDTRIAIIKKILSV